MFDLKGSAYRNKKLVNVNPCIFRWIIHHSIIHHIDHYHDHSEIFQNFIQVSTHTVDKKKNVSRQEKLEDQISILKFAGLVQLNDSPKLRVKAI